MTSQHFGLALALLAGVASAARSQAVPAPYAFGVPVTAPVADPFSAPLLPMGPQLPGSRASVRPANASGASPFYPTQIEQAYGLAALQGGTGTAAIADAGAGQTIAIIDAYHYNNALPALNTFSAGYNAGSGALWTLPQMSSSGSGPTFTQLDENGGTAVTAGTNSDWNGEEALDIEYVHAMAPQANIILYEANSTSFTDLFAAIQSAASNPAVTVVTMSWSGQDSRSDTSYNSYFTTPGTKAATGKNVTFCASTGDEGDINETPGKQDAGYPATSPNVVAVGGTSLYLTASNSYSYETAWSWNSSESWGGGGGTSAYESKPAWQSSYGSLHPGNILAKTTKRAEPDVSMVADPSTGVYVYDSANGGWNVAQGYDTGGTSLSSPLFAGLIADADGMRAAAGHATLSGTQTLTALYSLPSSDFNDITSGNISPTGKTAYSATTGYDLATGLGSPIANLLVPALAGYGIAPASYSLSTSPGTVTIHVASAGSFATTTISGSLVNTGSGANADSLAYGGFTLGASGGTLGGGTLPLSAGTLAAGSGTAGTATFSSNTAGSFTITATAFSVLNMVASGTPVLSGSNVTTIDVYRLAAPGVLAPISFGNVHVGATAAQALIIANTAANDGWSEALDAGFGSVAAGLVFSGSVGLLAPGGSSTAMSLAMNTATAGTIGGNVTVSFSSDGTGSSGLGLTALGSQTISVTGNVYSGQGVWNSNGGGSWTDFSKWTALGGVPGIDGALSAGDTALFGAALSSGSATVSLNGASPHVASLTFNSTASYTIAQGSGGTLNLDAGAGTAAITVVNGNHAIASPVTLASNAIFSQTAGSSLTISGNVGELGGSRALTQAGPGLLVLGGANTYSGPTTISGGMLAAANSGTLPANSDFFINGGTLDVTAGAQTVKSLTLGPAGALNVSVGNLLTCINTATFGNGALNIANYMPGSTEELIAYGAHANPGSDAFSSFTVDGSSSTGYQLEYGTNQLDIAPLLSGNTSILVPSTTSLSFGRVLASATTSLGDAGPTNVVIGMQSISVGLSSGTMSSTGATAAVLAGGAQGATITSATASGAGYITGASAEWTVSVGLGGGLGAHSDTVVIQNTGDSGSGPSGSAGPPPTGNQQGPIDVAVTGTVVSQRTVNPPALAVLPGSWQGSYHAGDAISVPVAFGYSYPGGGSGSISDTESASVAAYAGGPDVNGITLAGGPDSITSSAAFARTLTGTAAVGSGSGSFTLNVTPELSSSATLAVGYAISVTSGSMIWAGPSGGSWSSGGWTDAVAGGAPVAPGLNPAWTHSDVANFGSSSSTVATVNLDVSPSLSAITFSGTTGYTLAAAGGTLTLNNDGGGASILANASLPSVIDATVLLADNLTVAGSGELVFGASSTITDNGAGMSLTLNAGRGALVLSGSNDYSGGTTVEGGMLIATNDEAIADGSNLAVGTDLQAFETANPVLTAATASPAVPVPEPGTLVLFATAAAVCVIMRKTAGTLLCHNASYTSSTRSTAQARRGR